MKLPAGTYYIGDPCYVIAEDKWSEFCDISFYKGRSIDVTEFEGHPMFAAGTAHGDGCYEGSDGVGYGVDAGMLSVVPIDLVSDMSEAKRLGSIVKFAEEFEAYEENGTFYFGDIVIPTKWCEEADIDDDPMDL